MPNWSIALIPVLPLLATLWIAVGFSFGWNRGEKGEKETAYIASISILLSFLLVLGVDVSIFLESVQNRVQVATWLSTAEYQITIAFILDQLSLTMATLVSFIGLLVTRFSINYLHREAGYQRFFMLLSLFNTAMLLIALSANAVLTFIAWELAGVSSFLLIAYSWHRDIATHNAIRAFISNRIGDAGFLLGIAFAFFWLGTIEWTELASAAKEKNVSEIFLSIILLGFLIAALAKSAQFPFSAWITRALEGPTPSSAIFYGAIMVHAGVYLLLRLQPLLEQVPVIMVVIMIIGLITASYAYLVGLVQTDVKSSFMFSTLAQVGLMLVWIGNAWFSVALIHLVLHAIWRTYQFLHAPSFMQQINRPARPVPKWLAKQSWLYNAALQRFWLDSISDWLFTHPTTTIAREVQIFDEQVVDRLTGIQSHANMLSSLSHWEAHQQGRLILKTEIGTGSGLFGGFIQGLAAAFYWFEERLILKSSGEGLLKLIRHLGKHMQSIDRLLTQPRYLLLLIMATFVVVL